MFVCYGVHRMAMCVNHVLYIEKCPWKLPSSVQLLALNCEYAFSLQSGVFFLCVNCVYMRNLFVGCSLGKGAVGLFFGEYCPGYKGSSGQEG